MGAAKILGIILNLVFIGLVIGALAGAVAWPVVALAIPAFIVLVLVVGYVEGKATQGPGL